MSTNDHHHLAHFSSISSAHVGFCYQTGPHVVSLLLAYINTLPVKNSIYLHLEIKPFVITKTVIAEKGCIVVAIFRLNCSPLEKELYIKI